MPPNIYTDVDGRRVIIRNVGPPGIGIPAGGTNDQILAKDGATPYLTKWINNPDAANAVIGPDDSVNGNIVIFDGPDGNRIADSTRSLTYFATKSYADSKVDIDGDKVLSDNNYTDADKAKVEGLSGGGFRGSYATEAEIEDISEPQPGDRANLEIEDEDVVEYLWDAVNELWFPQSLDPVSMTGAEIADALFDDDEVWVKDECLIFTPTYKAMVDSHESTINAALGGGSGFQPLDATLTAFSGLVNAADKLPYFTGLDTMAVVTFTSVGRAVISAATAADQRTSLGIGTTDAPQVAGLAITSGSTARAGNATLAAGTVTVTNAAIAATDVIVVSRKTAAGTLGAGGYIYTLNAGVGFTITAVDLAGALVATDLSTVSYFILKIV